MPQDIAEASVHFERCSLLGDQHAAYLGCHGQERLLSHRQDVRVLEPSQTRARGNIPLIIASQDLEGIVIYPVL